ncbi:protein kinase family protein [Mumia quercus]|uniref:protein kinase family protein n=1 Tax=Mumia quercus TaxID=2976125 RepID=UPI0021CFDECF|nr:protein kinase family protein [Mumia quercus]
MDQTAALSSGTLLSGRYRLDDLIKESGGAVTWKAYDTVLDRNVGIQALRADDRRATAFVLAAGRSTAVSDPRFLRVLDIVEDDHGHTYLVREWARAVSLDHVLGPSTLTNARSTTVALELADAFAHAHDAGVYHRHLRPATVLLKENGGIRIIGLATDHALRSAHHDVDDADVGYAEQLDVEALGKILYACLTGRYPGGDELLAPAPREHGRILRPRQVRAGVSHDVDTICDRILGRPPRHHRPPLRTARDVALELAITGEEEPLDPDVTPGSSPDLFRHDPVRTGAGEPPPAVNPPKPRPAALAPPPPTPIERGISKVVRSTKGERGLIWIALAVIVVLAAVLTFILGRVSAPSDPTTRATEPPAEASRAVVDLGIKSVEAFDPPPDGDGQESPNTVEFATDGDPSTSWITMEYYRRNDLGGLKDGVGLLLDLGRPRDVTAMQVLFGAAPTSFRVYAAPGRNQPPTEVSQMERVGGYADAPTGASVSFSQPVKTRYLLLWLTRLPERENDIFQGVVSEVTVRGLE